MNTAVEREIRDLISVKGRITFAEFMQACLYSPKGGFYSTRGHSINTHFTTSSSRHPAFGALIARQLEEMWRVLGEPNIFHLIEPGSGDGLLARSIVQACRLTYPRFYRALRYVVVDYQPEGFKPPDQEAGRFAGGEAAATPDALVASPDVHKVKGEGLKSIRSAVGCILCNELVDNFPVHRFAIQGGKIREVLVALDGGNFVEVLGEPISTGIEQRLSSLGIAPEEGFRGEVCLALEDWTTQLAAALERGFVLTLDYGETAEDLYSSRNAGGTLVCYKQHMATADPYQLIGQQDITCLVDFTSLMRLGDLQGLPAVGFSRQRNFLTNLGFSSFLEALEGLGRSDARTEFNRIALMTLVDPEEFGDFKVLAQARGVGPDVRLLGFEGQDR